MMSSDAPVPIFSFEEVSSELEILPLAARRALDHAGLHLSLEGWRSLSLDHRRSLSRFGAADRVNVAAVEPIVRSATPPPSTMDREPDPDAIAPPAALPSSALLTQQWPLLRPIERYALVRAYKSSVKRGDPSIFEAAQSALLGASNSSLVPSGAPSSVSPTLPEYALTQEPGPPVRPTEPPVRPTRPPAWSTPFGPLSDDAQPGLLPQTMGPPVGSVDEVPGRHTLLSVPSDRTPLSSHLDASGAARMVDISSKVPTLRRAVASGSVRMLASTAARILRVDAPKGEVIGAARIAGIMAAKRTPELIPLCHGIALTHVGVDIQVKCNEDVGEAVVTATTEALDRTGVEMEAMVAVSVACLTIYDMLKGIDRAMTITGVRLLEKSGGRSGYFRRGDPSA